MNVIAEFVGGPMDGRIVMLEKPVPTYYVPQSPPVGSWVQAPTDEPPRPLGPLVYERSERRIGRSPTGDPVFRYRLRA